MYVNNGVKTRREISKKKKKDDYNELKSLVSERNNQFRVACSSENRRDIAPLTEYIKHYRKNELVSIKQVFFDPAYKNEIWEIKEKVLVWNIAIGREIDQLGVEIVFINSTWIKYKGIQVYLGSNLYSELGISEGYNQTIRFFKTLTDYSKNIIVKRGKK